MEWIRGPAIGRGATATVSLATSIPSGELFAVKSTELCHSMFLQREKYVLSKLSCPRIVKYLGYDVVANETTNNKPTYNLCMEYVPGGTLFEEIQRAGGRLDEERVRLCSQQILQGLDYLHVNGVVHCDMKSQNILIGNDGAKIADLGCAKLRRKGGDNEGFESFNTSAFSGTPAFMAPEVARGEEQGFEADIWAFGCTIIEMTTGNSPWPELNEPVSALYKIGFSSDVPEIPNNLSEKGKDFLEKCLKRDAKERWTAKELLHHPFLEDSDTPLKEVKESTMNSPCSVLDQGFWDSLDAVESPKNLIPEKISLNSPSDRIKNLLQGTVSPACNWTWSEDWVTVRSSDIEENKEISCSDEIFNVTVELEDELSFTIPSLLNPFEELEREGSILDELENSMGSSSTVYFSSINIRTDIELPFYSVTDDSFVSDNLNFETLNENSCKIQNPFSTFDSYSHFTR